MSGRDFWGASGHHLLDRDEGGGLVVTDEFLKAYLARPELVPPPEACPVERGIHAQLMANPRLAVPAADLALVADGDARENFSLFLHFRDHLLRYPTLERAYRELFRRDASGVPPLFIQQLTQVIARNAFDGCEDALVLRAAECFFRQQRVTFHEGAVLLADHEAIESHEHDRHASPLMAMLGGPAVSELTVLSEANGAEYFDRSDAHDFVFNLTAGVGGRAALAEAARLWMRHLTGVDLMLEPVETLSSAPVAWFLAFDAEATRIANSVWNGETPDPDAASRILALFSFTLPDSPKVVPDKRGKAGFAVLATTPDKTLAIKAQNLVAGLPLAPEQG